MGSLSLVIGGMQSMNMAKGLWTDAETGASAERVER